MKSIGERAPLRGSGSTAEPLQVFTDRSGTGVEMHVCADHLELHADGGKGGAGGLVSAHLNGWAVPREEGEALAITDRGGHVVMVPMAPQHMMQARWLIFKLMEWAERARARPGAWVRR